MRALANYAVHVLFGVSIKQELMTRKVHIFLSDNKH